MGRSAASCLKIIACGSDSGDHDDPENKGSSNRTGWGFRKRSARRQALGNTVISEAPFTTNKESSESTDVNFQGQPKSTLPEKTYTIQSTDEKSELSSKLHSKLPDAVVAREDDTRADETIDVSIVIVIQAAIRGFLAQKVLLKYKNITKLQAAVRGHLVRKHAVGTLWCVQAIVKMQTLVRARRTRLLVERSSAQKKQSENCGNVNYDPALLSEKEAKPNVTRTYTSIEKLLSNKFARQLMETTPWTKPINIKCDPLKSDSAWNWLERWMLVSSKSNEGPRESGLATEQHDRDKIGHPDSKEDIVTPFEPYSMSLGVTAGIEALPDATENTDTLITYNADNSENQSFISTSPSPSQSYQHSKADTVIPSEPYSESVGVTVGSEVLTDATENTDTFITYNADKNQSYVSTSPSPSQNLERPGPQNFDALNDTCTVTDSFPIQLNETGLLSKVEHKSYPGNAETEVEQEIHHDEEKFSSKQPETEAKNSFGSRKGSDPSFIAAKPKFEELNSADNTIELTSSSSQGPAVECNIEKMSSVTDQQFRSKEIDLSENSDHQASTVQVGSSGYGNELLVASILDSPVRSEVEAVEFESRQRISDGLDHPKSNENLAVEEKKSSIPAAALSHANLDKLESDDSLNSANIPTGSPQVEKGPDSGPSDAQLELGAEASRPVNKSSPEASPRSHMTTVSESQATPSTQVSMDSKEIRSQKWKSNWKGRSPSANKGSPSIANHDSVARSGLEQQPKEHKTRKRRNSLGSVKPDNLVQEPRDSSSSNSLPNYMQTTESARAKAIANSSPRSSPDVEDKDIYIKKRHSLSGLNGRQGSPRIQRSMSQAQQDAGGSGIHSPQERRWRR